MEVFGLKTNQDLIKITWMRRIAGWLVHAFTASGAFIGILALMAIHEDELLSALWLMGVAIVIDAVDGLLARFIKVKVVVPNIDGALLDNIVDFFNYTIVPAFFILASNLVPPYWRLVCVFIIILSSSYQFTQIDAKTSDHFFKGFPSYWNIAVFYLFFWQMNPVTNLWILILLAIMSFVPIKYVYPSRLDYLAETNLPRLLMLIATLLWGVATGGMLFLYPDSNHILVSISMGYILLYIGISLYRTWSPLVRAKHAQ